MYVGDPPPPPYEVIFGSDFLSEYAILINFGAHVLSSSIFGEIPMNLGPMNPFIIGKYVKSYWLKSVYHFKWIWIPDRRVILLVDMDCFEVQVYENKNEDGAKIVANVKDRWTLWRHLI